MTKVGSVDGERRELTTPDGQQIVWRTFEPPQREHAEGVVVIAAAMGVPQQFYRSLASWLANQGFIAVSFDYLGMGESRGTSLRGVTTDLIRWATQDASSVLRAVSARYPDLPITWIGHSQGGQSIAFLEEPNQLAKVVNVAAGNGHWRLATPKIRRLSGVLWWLVIPSFTAACGYFPGAKLGIVGDLPKGAVLQWRRWCLDRNYALGAEGPCVESRFRAVQVPLHAISLMDDELISKAAVDSLFEMYPNTQQSESHIDPRAEGLTFVGHMGFFRAANQALWPKYLLPELARRSTPWSQS